jgi:drug/metabolite transporter (DMT)-like permease
MAAKAHLLHSMHHLLTGTVLIIKGIDKISHHSFIGSLFLLFGVLILGFFFYTINKKHQGQNMELMVHWFEALVCLFTAYIFFTEGKRLIPYVFLLASAGFFIAIYMFHKRKKALAPK